MADTRMLEDEIRRLQQEVRELRAATRVRWVRAPLSTAAAGTEFINVRFTARTEITQVRSSEFGSTITGVYDWVEVEAEEGEAWKVKPDGRSGAFEDGTGAVEFHYGNMAMEGTYGQIKPLEAAVPASSTATSSSSSSVMGGFAYITDQAHTNFSPLQPVP